MVNKHIRNDEMTAKVSRAFFRKKGFFRESTTGPSFEEHVAACKVDVPPIGEEGVHMLSAETLVGPLATAFEVARWRGSDHPTVIYHHGNNERPFDRSRWAKNTFRKIFLQDDSFEANLIVVRAPFHDGSLKEYLVRIGRISDFMAMVSVSVVVTEAIIKDLRRSGNKSILVSGISLGGWVTNLHHALFSTADLYVPMLAGTHLGHVFTESSYSKLTSPQGMRDKDAVNALLDFHDVYTRGGDHRSRPLLAIHDRFIDYDVQSASYQGIDVNVAERGHVTATLDDKLLRRHLLESLRHLER